MSWRNILNSRQTVADIEEKLANQDKSFVEKSVVFTSLYQTNGNHATELSTVCHVISERHWKSTFNFTDTISNYGLQ